MADSESHTTIFPLTYKLGKLTLLLACSAFAPSSTQYQRHARILEDVRATVERLETHFASTAARTTSSTVHDRPPHKDGVPVIESGGNVEGVKKSSNAGKPDSTISRAKSRLSRFGHKSISSNGRLGKIKQDVELSNNTPRNPAALLITEIAAPTSSITRPEVSTQGRGGYKYRRKTARNPSSPLPRAHNPSPNSSSRTLPVPPKTIEHCKLPARSSTHPNALETPMPYAKRPSGAGNRIIVPEAMLDEMVTFGLVAPQKAVSGPAPWDGEDGAPTVREVDVGRERAVSEPLVRRR
ncbi:hypothetical protein J1614_003170 [Plenodomus biglobosus]|nr:hypothetical protein J1614_003170 [Plenodomus biglobosus]